jgi:hypothetical protein
MKGNMPIDKSKYLQILQILQNNNKLTMTKPLWILNFGFPLDFVVFGFCSITKLDQIARGAS